MIQRLELQNFTVFESLEIDFSPGVNVFIGENGTGKTHVLKVMYAPLSALYKVDGRKSSTVSRKLINVFLPKEKRLGRLVRRQKKGATAIVKILRNEKMLRLTFSTRSKETLKWNKGWNDNDIPLSTYIPVKEMLANAPNFLSTYDLYNIHFEEVYADIIRKAYAPKPSDDPDETRKALMGIIKKAIQGEIRVKEEAFFLKNSAGDLEFTLLAEGMRKLGLLWLLIQNGILQKGAVLFWDEPEANLNPKLMRVVVEILLKLQSLGVQIFIATHSYALLKEFDLQRKEHALRYYALYKDEEGRVLCNPAESYIQLHPNAIADHADRIYDMEIERKFGSPA